MKKTILTLALLLTGLSMNAQITLGKNDMKFEAAQYEIIEVIINGSLIKGVDIFADGDKVKRVKFSKRFRQRKKTSWIILLKKAGFVLTESETIGNTYKGTSGRPTIMLIFEKK